MAKALWPSVTVMSTRPASLSGLFKLGGPNGMPPLRAAPTSAPVEEHVMHRQMIELENRVVERMTPPPEPPPEPEVEAEDL